MDSDVRLSKHQYVPMYIAAVFADSNIAYAMYPNRTSIIKQVLINRMFSSRTERTIRNILQSLHIYFGKSDYLFDHPSVPSSIMGTQ